MIKRWHYGISMSVDDIPCVVYQWVSMWSIYCRYQKIYLYLCTLVLPESYGIESYVCVYHVSVHYVNSLAMCGSSHHIYLDIVRIPGIMRWMSIDVIYPVWTVHLGSSTMSYRFIYGSFAHTSSVPHPLMRCQYSERVSYLAISVWWKRWQMRCDQG